MRAVFGVHDPQRELIVRSVIFDGARPTTGSHLRSSAGSCRSIDCRARSSDCSFQLKAPSAAPSRCMLTALTGTSGSTFGEANVRERAAAILRSASSSHARRSRTNRTMSCCGMRAGAVTSTAPYGGLTRRYMLRFFLRSTLTCTPSTVMTSREISACGEVERPASERARGRLRKGIPDIVSGQGDNNDTPI